MDVDIEKIKELADLAKSLDLAELKVSDGDKKVTIKTVVAGGAPASAVYHNGLDASSSVPVTASVVAETIETVASAPAVSENHHTITSPMVGTFYRKPAPDAPSFADAGQMVSVGQTLCIIEAMKLMNELESDVSGKVVKFLVEDGEPVEFGQALLLVEV